MVASIPRALDTEEYHRLQNTKRIIQDELDYMLRELRTLQNQKNAAADDIADFHEEIAEAKEELFEINQLLKAYI